MPSPDFMCDFPADPSIAWQTSQALVPYREALAEQEARNAAIRSGEGRELIWQLEHPPVYTGGTTAQPSDLIDPRFEVVQTGRGGQYTYHGPGQRVTYVLLDLRKRGRAVRRFVHGMEQWVIGTLGDFGIEAWAVCGRVGIWTKDIDGREAKIGAIGVRVKRGVTMHGMAVNLDPDLSHFAGIVPCGISEFGVTSMARLGVKLAPDEWDAALQARGGDFLASLQGEAKV